VFFHCHVAAAGWAPTTHQSLPSTTLPASSAQLDLSNQIIGYWTRFAATGSPNGGTGTGAAAPHWPRYVPRDAQIQQLVPDATAPQSAAGFAAFHHCAFWASLAGSS
jgi:para-nitrobenzyl esterase